MDKKSASYYTGKTAVMQYLFGPLGVAAGVERQTIDQYKVTYDELKKYR